MHALRTILAAAGAVALLAAGPAAAHPPSGHVGVEPVYFDGQTLHIIQASATSQNPNQAFFACYPLGPDLSASGRSSATPTMYVVLAPGATQHSCSDGSLTHDHVLSTAPGNAGYTGAWTAILAVPGPFFGAAEMPITSVTELDAAVAAGQLVLVDPGVRLLAPVLTA